MDEFLRQARELTREVHEASDTDRPEEISAADGVLRVERDPEPGVTLRAVPEGAGDRPPIRCTLFAAGPSPPGAYPADLPHLPGLPAVVLERVGPQEPPVRGVQWTGVPDPEEAAAEIVRRSTDAGWDGGEESGSLCTLRRDDARRHVITIRHGEEGGSVIILETGRFLREL